MTDSTPTKTAPRSAQGDRLLRTAVLGIFIVIAAVVHALLGSRIVSTAAPLRVDTIVGEIHVRERAGVAHQKCNGFKIECYESFVIIYVNKEKEPTWTGNYVLVYPWSKIEHLVMAGQRTEL